MALAERAIWLAKPATFNDPFDCALTLDRSLYRSSIIHAITAGLQQGKIDGKSREKLYKEWPGDGDAFETMRNGIPKILGEMGVCCFSESSTEILLWSHYADNHKGFCIEFDFQDGTLFRKNAKKVRYSDTIPKLSAVDFSVPKREETFDILWLTKSSHWAYEKEWRVMMSEGDKNYAMPSKITSIIFGAKMPESDRRKITEVLREDQEIIFKEAFLVDGKFEINLRDLREH